MSELKQRIHENGIDYVLVGDYYIPDIRLPDTDHRPIGRWGRLHRDYLREEKTLLYNQLVLTCRLHSYLADLNEQAESRYELIMKQMMEQQGVDEAMKRRSQMDWVQAVNGIAASSREIINHELIYV